MTVFFKLFAIFLPPDTYLFPNHFIQFSYRFIFSKIAPSQIFFNSIGIDCLLFSSPQKPPQNHHRLRPAQPAPGGAAQGAWACRGPARSVAEEGSVPGLGHHLLSY